MGCVAWRELSRTNPSPRPKRAAASFGAGTAPPLLAFAAGTTLALTLSGAMPTWQLITLPSTEEIIPAAIMAEVYCTRQAL